MTRLLLASVPFALFPFLASAIPVTSGTITLSGFSIDNFNFCGPDFSVSDGMHLGNWGPARCSRCPPGSVLGLNGTEITLDAGPGTYHSTFTFNGSSCGIVGSSSGAEPKPCLVDLRSLTGSGIVDVNINSVGGGLEYTGAVYKFAPEPHTWMLSLVGIVAVLGWCQAAAPRDASHSNLLGAKPNSRFALALEAPRRLVA